MQRVALLGLGAMGAGMAASWLNKGFPLTVWNRTPARADAIAAMGARAAGTPRAAAEGADVIVAVVTDDAASRAVWLGTSGALAGAKSGAICVESSTLSPEWVRELAELAKARGCRFLDAPIGASRQAAAAGQLVFFVGGEADAVAAAQPVLEAIATLVVHAGEAGAGATWKLINNMLIAVELAAVAEALALARKAGFSADLVSALIDASSAASPIVKAKLERMIQGRFDDPDFALALIHKDARYGLALAHSLNARHGMIAAAATAYGRVEAMGLGALDCAAVAT